MAIIEKRITEKLEVLPDGQIQVKERDVYVDDTDPDTVLAVKSTHRRVIDVGDDVTNEPTLVKDVVNGRLHTPVRKTRRQAFKAAQAAKNPPGQRQR